MFILISTIAIHLVHNNICRYVGNSRFAHHIYIIIPKFILDFIRKFFGLLIHYKNRFTDWIQDINNYKPRGIKFHIIINLSCLQKKKKKTNRSSTLSSIVNLSCALTSASFRSIFRTYLGHI